MERIKQHIKDLANKVRMVLCRLRGQLSPQNLEYLAGWLGVKSNEAAVPHWLHCRMPKAARKPPV